VLYQTKDELQSIRATQITLIRLAAAMRPHDDNRDGGLAQRHARDSMQAIIQAAIIQA